MTGKDWATLALALVGATTGIASLAWNISIYLRRDRPQLNLSYSWGYGIVPHLGEGFFVGITAANQTRHAVTVESVGFDLSNGKQLLFRPNPMYPLPYEVKPGGKYEAWEFIGAVRATLAEEGRHLSITGVWANDAVGKRWTHRMPHGWSDSLLTVQIP